MSFKKAVVVSTPHKPLPLRLYCFLAVTLVIAGCSGEQLGDTNGGLAAGGSAGVVLGVGAVVATGVLLANDDDDNDGNVVGGTPPAGTPLTPVSFNDTEPNNNPDAAQSLGDLSPDMSGFTGSGSVSFSDAPGDDEFDSYQVRANGAQTLTVVVAHADSVDIDVAFVDPATGNILTELCDEPVSPETCALTLSDGQVVNIEAEAVNAGAADYTIDITTASP